MTPFEGQTRHGTVVAALRGARRLGVWIVGPSGAGKSDLAMRLMGRGWRLTADDQAHVFASGGAIYAAAPARLDGLIEVRGLGIEPVRASGLVRLVLRVELTDRAVERMPEPETWSLDGIALPLLRLDPREASAVEKVAAAVARL